MRGFRDAVYKKFETECEAANFIAGVKNSAVPIVVRNLGGNSTAKVFCDGGSRGNPGLGGAGIAIFGPDLAPLLKKGFYMGELPYTNNQAEYYSLLKALREAKNLDL